MKSFLASMVLLLATGVATAADSAPDVVVRSVTDEVLAILGSDKEGQRGNPRNVKQRLEAVVLPHFNFHRMTQLAMGRHWRQATPEQQKAVTEEFRALLMRTYITAIALLGRQTIDYLPLQAAHGQSDVVVRSLLRRPGGQPVTIDYRMEKLAGAWQAYDVTVDGMSLVLNYRSTFNSQIEENGIEGLIKALARKNQALAAEPTR